jgi:MoaA/NifB/PqqE/SkfB family radical SAM enzyme
MQRKRGFMPPALFARIIDEISSSKMAPTVLFNLMGEPLLHPHIFDLLNVAAQKIPRQILITNGSLFDELNTIRCFETGITDLDISYYSHKSDLFKLRNARNLSFEQYRSKIENIVKVKFLRGYKTHLRIYYPNIELLSFGRGSHNQHLASLALINDYVHEWTTFLEKLGVNTNVCPNIKAVKEKDIKKGFSIFLRNDFELVIKPFHNWLNAGCNVRKARFGKCRTVLFREQLGIQWNGDVVLCCADHEGGTKFGNVRNKSLAEVLAGKEYQRIIESFSKGIIPINKCKTCFGDIDFKALQRRQIGLLLANFKLTRPIVDKLQKEKGSK